MSVPSRSRCFRCRRAQTNNATKTPIRIAPTTTPSIMYNVSSSRCLRRDLNDSPASSSAAALWDDSCIPRLPLTFSGSEDVVDGSRPSVRPDNVNIHLSSSSNVVYRHLVNPFNASCSKLLLFGGLSCAVAIIKCGLQYNFNML